MKLWFVKIYWWYNCVDWLPVLFTFYLIKSINHNCVINVSSCEVWLFVIYDNFIQWDGSSSPPNLSYLLQMLKLKSSSSSSSSLSSSHFLNLGQLWRYWLFCGELKENVIFLRCLEFSLFLDKREKRSCQRENISSA